MKKETLQGIGCMLLSSLGFALMSLLVRLAGDLPTGQKCFFRNLVAFLVALVLFLRGKEKVHIDRHAAVDLFLRSAAGTIGIACNFYAVDHMLVADATMLNKLSPFFSILFSAALLKEKVRRMDLVFVLTAFAGSLLIIRPSFSMSVFPALVGLTGGLMAGLAYTYVRKLGLRGVPGPFIVMVFSGFSCVAFLPSLLLSFRPMTARQTVYLLLTGVCAALAQFAITAAYTKAPARDISSFGYSQVVFAALLGYLFLAQAVDVLSLCGYVVVIGSAVACGYYQKRHAERELRGGTGG